MTSVAKFARTTVSVLAIASMLAACNDSPRPPQPINQTAQEQAPEDVPVYENIDACMASYSEAECRDYKLVAETEHEKTAPRFDTPQTCEERFGPGHCRSIQTSNGHSVFIPAMVGFALGAAIGAAAGHAAGQASANRLPPRPIYYSAPRAGRPPMAYSGNQGLGSNYNVHPAPLPNRSPAPPPPAVGRPVVPAAPVRTPAAVTTPAPTPAPVTMRPATPPAAIPRVTPPVPAPSPAPAAPAAPAPAPAPAKAWAPPVVKEVPRPAPAPAPVTATPTKTWSAPAVPAARPTSPPPPVFRSPTPTVSRPTAVFSRPSTKR